MTSREPGADLHLITILPDIVELDDVGMLNQLEDGHFPLDSQGHAADTAGTVGLIAIHKIELGNAARLRQHGVAPGHDLDSDGLVRDFVASDPHTG